FALDAKHNIAAFANQYPFNLAGSVEGSLTFTSSKPVAVTALRGFTNERGEFLMTALPVVPVMVGDFQSSTVLPQFAEGNGWSTQVILMNPTNAPLMGTIQFFGAVPSSDPFLTAGISYTIAPRSSVRFRTADLGLGIREGYVLVRAADRNPV